MVTVFVMSRSPIIDSSPEVRQKLYQLLAIMVYTRSKIPAAPMPVPTHMVTMPYFRLLRRRPWMAVAERRLENGACLRNVEICSLLHPLIFAATGLPPFHHLSRLR